MGEAVAAEAVAPQLRPPQVAVEAVAVPQLRPQAAEEAVAEERRPPPQAVAPRRLPDPPRRLLRLLRRWSVRVGSATTTAASTNPTSR